MLAEDEQWAKLRMIVEIAEEVWGKSDLSISGACRAKKSRNDPSSYRDQKESSGARTANASQLLERTRA